MNPEARPSDSLIGLIQPFLDDELAPAERARVEALLAEDPVLREMVGEQRTVRQVLRDMPRETAPQALGARVLLELDAVDRELAAARAPTRAAPAWRRLRAFLRGASVMVPAGATALAMFLVLRTGSEGHVAEDSNNPAPASNNLAASAPALAPASPLLGQPGPLLLGSAPAPSPGVRLVSAALPSDERDAPSSVVVTRQVGSRRVLDRHEPAGPRGSRPPGQPREYRGRNYWLGQLGGQPAVAFESDGVRHTLTRDGEGFRDDREYMFLLSLGHALQDAERGPAR